MIRLIEIPKTFVYGFYNQEIDELQYNDLFTDNLYSLEKILHGQYPSQWTNDCIKLVVNGFEESVTEALCYLHKYSGSETNIKYINIIMWPNKMFFNWESITSKYLKLNQEVLERNGFESQDHFIYSVNCKTHIYA